MRQMMTGVVALGLCVGAWAQTAPTTLRDLEGKSPRALSKEELEQLMPGAKLQRVSNRGSNQMWTNDKDGNFVASSDNRGLLNSRGSQMQPSTANGKWHLSGDGRYCVLIDWKSVGNEEWCRFVLQTSDGYYMVRSTSVGTEAAHRFEISK